MLKYKLHGCYLEAGHDKSINRDRLTDHFPHNRLCLTLNGNRIIHNTTPADVELKLISFPIKELRQDCN